MRHFLAYHNAKKMRFSSTALADAHVKTKNSVAGLEGATVWLLAGEGKSPKTYYLAAKFIANKCETNKFPGTELPNQVSGVGKLYKLSKPITGTSLLSEIQTKSLNFRKGFHEIKDSSIISGLTALA